MTLAEYLAETKTTPGAFAKKLGVPPSTVWRWLFSIPARRPKTLLALQVAEATGGTVPVTAWGESAPSKRPTTGKGKSPRRVRNGRAATNGRGGRTA